MLENNHNEKKVIQRLIKWYSNNKRTLPWRKKNSKNLPNPYYVFVSEFMLQQTTVNAVIPRFLEFIDKWPNLKKFSSINENEITKFWSGLGYYARSKNLLKSAKIIQKNFKGKIPSNYEDLINLPGVGDYTAKAIIGIAYNKPVMPVDANIERILARLNGFKNPLKKIKLELINVSNEYVSKKLASNLIQAFMDYGSIICTPRNPNCNNCVIKFNCISFKKNLQNIIPVKIKPKKQKRKKYSRAYIFFNEYDEILVRRRPSKGMLASMLEVPNDNWTLDKKKLFQDKIVNKIKKKIKHKGLIEYSFSHFDLQIEVFFANVKKNNFSKYKWIKKNNFKKSGLPTVMKKIVEFAV